MKQKTTLGRIEFDNETYEITGRTRSGNATTGPAPIVGELQLGLLGAVASRGRRAAPLAPRGQLPDDLVGLRRQEPGAALSRQPLH